MSKITDYILIIIAGIILIIIAGYVIFAGRQTSDTETCRMSAQAATTLRPSKQLKQMIELECETDFIIVNGSKITKDGKKITDITEGRAQDQAKRVIANEMYDCWYQLGAGDYDLFGNFEGGDVQCLVCSYIDFDQSYNKQYGNLEDFNEFLDKKIPGKDISYARYLSKNGLEKGQIPKVDIDTTQSYGVIFVSMKEDLSDDAKVAGGSLAACLAGTYIGAKVGATTLAAGGSFFFGFGAVVGGVVGGVGGAIVGCGAGLITATVYNRASHGQAEEKKEENNGKTYSLVLISASEIGEKCEIMY
ncbi:MAG: hypothetical protein Q8O89_05130 [Nanoarchaeota archaeon]|nr:hypothetical protein [Nanoarchaeota archaeon]